MQRDVRTRKKEFLGSISGGQNVPTWRTKREQLKDTLITPRPSCLLWCTRETIGPQGPKNSSTWSLASEISSFSSFLFPFFMWRGCSVIYLPRGATSTRFRRFETAHEIATSVADFSTTFLAHRSREFEPRGPKFGPKGDERAKSSISKSTKFRKGEGHVFSKL